MEYIIVIAIIIEIFSIELQLRKLNKTNEKIVKLLEQKQEEK